MAQLIPPSTPPPRPGALGAVAPTTPQTTPRTPVVQPTTPEWDALPVYVEPTGPAASMGRNEISATMPTSVDDPSAPPAAGTPPPKPPRLVSDLFAKVPPLLTQPRSRQFNPIAEKADQTRHDVEALAKFGQYGLEMYGGAMGARVARRIGDPIVRGIVGMTGAGVGAGTATAIGEGIVKPEIAARYAPEGAPPPKPPRLRDVAKPVLESAQAGVLGEVGAAGLQTTANVARRLPVRALGNYWRRRMSPDQRAAAEFAGGNVSPGQISSSGIVQYLDNIASATFGRNRYSKMFERYEDEVARTYDREIAKFGPLASRSEAGEVIRGGRITQASHAASSNVYAAQQQAGGQVAAAQQAISQADTEAGRALERVSARLGRPAGPEVVGERSQTLIQVAHDAADRAQNEIYEDLWSQFGDTPADITALQERGAALSAETGTIGTRTGVQGRAQRPLGALTPEQTAEEAAEAAVHEVPGYDTALRALQSMNPADPRRFTLEQTLNEIKAGLMTEGGEEAVMTARQLHKLRSFYGKMSRTIGDESQAGVFKQLHEAADHSLAASLPPEAMEQYRTASALHRGMIERFEEGALAKIVEKHPTEALQAILRTPGAGSVADVNLVREVLGPEGWREIQSRVWQDMIAFPDGTPRKAIEIIRRLREWEPEHAAAVFSGVGDLIAQSRPALTAAAIAQRVPGRPTAQVDQAIRAGQTQVQKARDLDPYDLVAKLSTRSGPREIATLERVVGPEGWKKVQSQSLQQLLHRGEDTTHMLPPKLLGESLRKVGRERLVALYGRDTTNFLFQWARMGEQLAKKSPVGAQGSMWIQMATPAAAASVLTTAYTGDWQKGAIAGGGILLTPYVMARIATSPTMQKALIGAASSTMRGETGMTARLIAQLTAQLVREGVIGAKGGPPPTPTAPGPGQGATTGMTQPLGRGQGPGPGAVTGGPPGVPPGLLAPTR